MHLFRDGKNLPLILLFVSPEKYWEAKTRTTYNKTAKYLKCMKCKYRFFDNSDQTYNNATLVINRHLYIC